MIYLMITTVLWAFSFSLIGDLAGTVDSSFSVMARVGLASLLFLPFIRVKQIPAKVIVLYMLVGALQLGIMYLFVFHAYLYLSVSEFLLFSIITPLYITLIYDLISHKPLRWGYLFSATIAVMGAGIIRYAHLSEHFWFGLLLVQMANLCFAAGLVGYKRLMELHPLPNPVAIAWFYLGAFIVSLIMWLLIGDINKLPTTETQWITLAWLGLVASGLGYFMWNYGATKVDAGTLGIMNNIHVPAGLLVNFVIWQQQPHWPSFILGGALIFLSLWVHQRFIK